jgi:Flp pilus assembly protein TadG
MSCVIKWLQGRCSAVRKSFTGDKSGNVAMMFGLLVIPLIGAIGLAIDMGRTYHVAVHTQGALDAAALAAGRVAQIEKTDTTVKASKAASAYFDQTKPTDVVQSNIVFAPNSQQTEFTVTATSWVRTPFLSVLKLFSPRGSDTDAPAACKDSYYACTKVTSTATAQICLNCSDVGGGNADDGTNLEIAMMLDLTGSMAGDKIVDLQIAAKDLIDIVVWATRASTPPRSRWLRSRRL